MSNFIALENITVTLNETTITGFSDDTDALGLPATIDIATVKRGADGKMTGMSTGDKGGPVVFKLLPTSDSNKFFSLMAEQQKNGAAVVFNGRIENSLNGSSIDLVNGLLTSYTPLPSVGKGSVANPNYTIEFERLDGHMTSANFS